MKNKITPFVQELAIICLTIIIIAAMFLDYNGALLVSGVAAISGIAGYNLHTTNQLLKMKDQNSGKSP